MESLQVLDKYTLNFSQDGLLFLNISLGIIMFGVALGINLSHFKELFRNPKSVLTGLVSQFVLLPFLTYLLILAIKPTESVALGMILVAACPGGNISNFISSLAKGNVALSVTLTGVSTMLSVLLTPINFAFWGGLYISTSDLLRPIEIDFFQMFQTVILILGLPLIAGIIFAKKLPKITAKIQKPIKIISIVIFGIFVAGALANNFKLFLSYIHLIFLIVLAHNAIAFGAGYFISKLLKLSTIDRKTISIETGIQNSGLALVLIFNPQIFPSELQIGGMAFIAAWWGIWHMVSGLTIAHFWSKKN